MNRTLIPLTLAMLLGGCSGAPTTPLETDSLLCPADDELEGDDTFDGAFVLQAGEVEERTACVDDAGDKDADYFYIPRDSSDGYVLTVTADDLENLAFGVYYDCDACTPWGRAPLWTRSRDLAPYLG